MGLLDRLRRLFTRSGPGPLDEWFHVRFDDERVYLEVEPPGDEAWQDEFTWQSIERIAFKAEGLELSDGIYVYTSQRPESYVIPTEAHGGLKLWGEILERGLFDPDLAIRAATALEGTFVWPEVEEPEA